MEIKSHVIVAKIYIENFVLAHILISNREIGIITFCKEMSTCEELVQICKSKEVMSFIDDSKLMFKRKHDE